MHGCNGRDGTCPNYTSFWNFGTARDNGCWHSCCSKVPKWLAIDNHHWANSREWLGTLIHIHRCKSLGLARAKLVLQHDNSRLTDDLWWLLLIQITEDFVMQRESDSKLRLIYSITTNLVACLEKSWEWTPQCHQMPLVTWSDACHVHTAKSQGHLYHPTKIILWNLTIESSL